MRVKTILGSLLLSAALCSPGFGLELLDRLLGLEKCGADNCGVCAACKSTCSPCAKPETCTCASAECAKPCRPLLARVKAVCAKTGCETGCETGCDVGCKPRCTPVRDLLASLKAPSCSDVVCAPAPCKPKCHKLYRRPVIELIETLFCCGDTCGIASCGDGDCGEACNGAAAPAPAPAAKALSPTPAPEKSDLVPLPVPAKKALAPAPAVPTPESPLIPTPAN